jgi:hypothetical protein
MLGDPYIKNEIFVTSLQPSPRNIPNFSKNLGRTLNWIGKIQEKRRLKIRRRSPKRQDKEPKYRVVHPKSSSRKLAKVKLAQSQTQLPLIEFDDISMGNDIVRCDTQNLDVSPIRAAKEQNHSFANVMSGQMHASKFLSDDYQLKIEPVAANLINKPIRQKSRSKSREALPRPISSPRKVNAGPQIKHEPATKA